VEEKTPLDLTDVFLASDNIITSLGFTTDENISALKAGETGIKLHTNDQLSPSPFWASMVDRNKLTELFSAYENPREFTRFEQLVICSLKDALNRTSLDISGERTLVILSSTKGNIDMLDAHAGSGFESDRVYLWHTANLIRRFFGLHHTPMVVSNACISGVMAVIIGSRLIRAGRFDHVVVTGADLVTEFVLSGFNSFLSLCQGPCKPFDRDRQGLSLGEAAGTIILTGNRNMVTDAQCVAVGPGFSSNDANHISGPSRTGEGLYIAIKKTLEKSNMAIDYISAHGTATPYNDEMESMAITRAGLQNTPVNSLKGYWGHTLGAAGIIEAISGIYSIRNNILFNTLGFSSMGVTNPVAVIDRMKHTPIRSCLKIASGFGGCNASLLFYK
jgi:3-oxoacyl-[acyl-carrier-protein] synthase-1